jgi:hypothetical protein
MFREKKRVRDSERREGSQPTSGMGHTGVLLLSLADITVGFAGKWFVVPMVGLAFFLWALITPKVIPKTMAISIKMPVTMMQSFFEDGWRNHTRAFLVVFFFDDVEFDSCEGTSERA